MIAPSPGRDLAQFAVLEDRFCRDFACCGTTHETLHDLLQHFEECHSGVAGDGDDGGVGIGGGGASFLGGGDYEMDFDDMDDDDDDEDDDRVDELPFEFDGMEHDGGFDFGYGGAAAAAARRNSAAVRELQQLLLVQQRQRQQQQHQGVATISYAAAAASAAAPATPASLLRHAARDDDADDSRFDLFGRSAGGQSGFAYGGHGLGYGGGGGGGGGAGWASSAVAAAFDDGGGGEAERPFRCRQPGCGKAYKNPGGLKYHMKNGHGGGGGAAAGVGGLMDEDGGIAGGGDPAAAVKPYLCPVPECAKRYKNLNGLKYHIEHVHLALLGTMGFSSEA
ncbi:Transcriptional regulator of ribosomal biogenesis proteins [Cladochytrium tenue]|nr:Transcriptional regulator of ribosomal biogenesis proteins [Cladochytrium tenue]